MPSNSLNKFESDMIVDVERVIENHSSFGSGAPGKRALGHLTSGGVLLLCAAWESYIEDVIIELARAISDAAEDAPHLPKQVQQTIASTVKSAKNELEVLRLSGNGWKSVYHEIVAKRVAELNTPKIERVEDLFEKLLGCSGVKERLGRNSTDIDKFCQKRGEIAHRGNKAGYVTLNVLRDDYVPLIRKSITIVDNYLVEQFRRLFPTKRAPWNMRNG